MTPEHRERHRKAAERARKDARALPVDTRRRLEGLFIIAESHEEALATDTCNFAKCEEGEK